MLVFDSIALGKFMREKFGLFDVSNVLTSALNTFKLCCLFLSLSIYIMLRVRGMKI